MTKELAETHLAYMKKIKRDYAGDLEMLHIKLDDIILELLKNCTQSNKELEPVIGEIISEFNNTDKWYA